MHQYYTIKISFWKLLKVNYLIPQKHHFKGIYLFLNTLFALEIQAGVAPTIAMASDKNLLCMGQRYTGDGLGAASQRDSKMILVVGVVSLLVN